jgi:hypothetical protein
MKKILNNLYNVLNNFLDNFRFVKIKGHVEPLTPWPLPPTRKE